MSVIEVTCCQPYAENLKLSTIFWNVLGLLILQQTASCWREFGCPNCAFS